jgi:hypothetical protein
LVEASLDEEEEVEELRLRFLGLGVGSRKEVLWEDSKKSMKSGSWNVHKSSTDAGDGSTILKC